MDDDIRRTLMTHDAVIIGTEIHLDIDYGTTARQVRSDRPPDFSHARCPCGWICSGATGRVRAMIERHNAHGNVVTPQDL